MDQVRKKQAGEAGKPATLNLTPILFSQPNRWSRKIDKFPVNFFFLPQIFSWFKT
jgi:hypothetical protein